MSSLPLIRAKYDSNPLDDFPDQFDNSASPYKDRDDLPLIEFGIFWLFFILQTVIFVTILYCLYIGHFDEKFFRPKSKIPFYSHLNQDIETEYEKKTPVITPRSSSIAIGAGGDLPYEKAYE